MAAQRDSRGKVRMKIRTIAEIAGILIVIGVLSASGAAYYAFQTFKVGGPVYSGIVLTKDLVSDILPPPEYIVEAYLEATLALNDPANAKEHAARISVLEKDYGERRRYWEASPLEVSLKQRLTRGAHQPAAEFWTLARQSFFPALQRADIAAARDAYGRMTRAYFAHRAQIDNVVTEANRLNAATEQAAATEERRIEWRTLALLATVVALILASAAGTVLFLVRQIAGLKSSIQALAEGKSGAEIPYCNASSEIGYIARAMQVLEGNLAEHERLRSEKDEAEREAAERRKGEMEALADVFETAIGQVVCMLPAWPALAAPASCAVLLRPELLHAMPSKPARRRATIAAEILNIESSMGDLYSGCARYFDVQPTIVRPPQ